MANKVRCGRRWAGGDRYAMEMKRVVERPFQSSCELVGVRPRLEATSLLPDLCQTIGGLVDDEVASGAPACRDLADKDQRKQRLDDHAAGLERQSACERVACKAADEQCEGGQCRHLTLNGGDVLEGTTVGVIRVEHLVN
jgi:hypothetical protein